jgi:hypothetical protein
VNDDNEKIAKAVSAARIAKAAMGARRARARLSALVTQEVSLVDRAANNRVLVIAKALGGPFVRVVAVR